jgi:hypothetical protein
MDKRVSFSSLKATALIWCGSALFAGMASVWIWTSSNAAWDNHLTASYQAGYELYDTLTNKGPTKWFGGGKAGEITNVSEYGLHNSCINPAPPRIANSKRPFTITGSIG